MGRLMGGWGSCMGWGKSEMIAFPDWSGKPVEEQNLLVGTIVDIILDDLLLDDCLLQEIFPDRMIVEDKGRCLAVIRELSLWARDGWTHYLGNLHEYALDGVLWLWQSIEKEEREYLLCSRELDTKFREAAKSLSENHFYIQSGQNTGDSGSASLVIR